MLQFITPIVKATKTGKQAIAFYTIPEYEQWREGNNNGKGWTIKYYKGLGTSSSAEAKTYFGNLPLHRKPFKVFFFFFFFLEEFNFLNTVFKGN